MAFVKAYGITHRGYVREINEDAILMDRIVIQEDYMTNPYTFEADGDNFIFAVADGLGGHPKGELASRLVLEVLAKERPKSLTELNDTLHKAHEVLINYVKVYGDALGLGTALAGILISGENLHIFNVGDCRVYRLEGNKPKLLTKDHRAVNGSLYSAIVGYPGSWEFEMYAKSIKAQGSLIICSDGLWQFVEEEEFNRPVEELLDLALLSGGFDNVSIIKVHVSHG